LATASSDGKVHTTFNQTGTVTGRLSSEAPNMQNIPIRSDYGARIRDAFVASSGYTLASFDYSQIELRILAAFAEDEKMIEAFNNDADIHKLTAALINNVSIDDVTPKMRSRAKAINFGIIYGMGVTQLARNTGMGMEDAKKFYQEYFNDFPRVRAYINSVKQKVKAVGYVETLFGRKRWFDLAKIGGGFAEAEMERMAVNAIIQGTDADIVKLAMIAVHNVLGSNEAYPLLQVHDELLYEIRDDKLNVVVPKIIHEMQSVAELKVRLSVSAKTGKRLGSMQNFI
jgi:DNA polymerase I